MWLSPQTSRTHPLLLAPGHLLTSCGTLLRNRGNQTAPHFPCRPTCPRACVVCPPTFPSGRLSLLLSESSPKFWSRPVLIACMPAITTRGWSIPGIFEGALGPSILGGSPNKISLSLCPHRECSPPIPSCCQTLLTGCVCACHLPML